MPATKHTAPENGGAHYRVPPEPNRWPSIGLAVGVHALLIAFLVIGVNWQNNTPVAVEAEIWDVTTQTAAPPPPPPEPEPEPEPETPPPEPTPRAVPPPPPPVEQPAPPKQPDIALEREKKRQEDLKRKEEARQERERELAEQKRIEQKREDDRKAKELADKKERDEAKKARDLADKKEREAAEKKAQDLAKKEEADKKKKAEKDKAEKLAKDKAENAKLAKLRDEEMKRLMAGAGNPGSTGSAAQSTAPRTDKGYVAAITAKVKGNTSYPGSTDEPGNPTASFRVQQLPTGEIVSVSKIKSSGVPAFDDAVEKGITKSSPLPKKKDGTVERSLVIDFHMKDLQ
jgi:colicin import membrane protein